MSKIKIAFFLDVMQEDFDGVAITMHQIIRRIPRDQFEAIFVTPQPPSEDIGFPVHLTPSFKLPESDKEYLIALPKKMKNLHGILDAFRPDILHYSSPTPLGSYATKYAKRHHVPVVSIYHTHYPSFVSYYIRFIPNIEKYFNPIFKWLYAMYFKADRIFAPTPSMYRYLESIGIKESNLSVWGRGVNLERFSPEHREENYYPVPKGNKKVLFVSRLVREKEPETLVRLYQLMDQKRSDLNMIIVGDGPTRNELQKKMPNAIFKGRLTGMELATAYASGDVFVFPSTTETFGNVVLEALASGLPVVAANAGGPSDIIQDGHTGFLVEPKNERAFFEKVEELIDDPALYQQIRKNALDYASSQTWEKLSSQLFDEYKRLVKSSDSES
ncbi:glycosyltransferase family 4 protein [Marinoscillum sp.]|uniref:glycosyltransferase family 4 protein n=1 Tax=Marinoscillum sp. TaxID=2024838 RepID=UPI003BA8F7B6